MSVNPRFWADMRRRTDAEPVPDWAKSFRPEEQWGAQAIVVLSRVWKNKEAFTMTGSMFADVICTSPLVASKVLKKLVDSGYLKVVKKGSRGYATEYSYLPEGGPPPKSEEKPSLLEIVASYAGRFSGRTDVISHNAAVIADAGWVGKRVRHKLTGVVGKIEWDGRDYGEGLVLRSGRKHIPVDSVDEFAEVIK